ncbi:MAG: carbon-nitrogen hydrolase family protein, partial [Gemmatimonadota bacterium]
PECFVPSYPLWVWFVPPGDTHTLRDLYSQLLENAVTVPSDVTDRVAEAAREAGTAVAIGVNEANAEASGATLYNTTVLIDATGEIVGKHRKLVPTAGERLVHGMGDGSTLAVHELAFGRVSCLICWENYMPLARYAMWAWGAQIHVAPTWDRGEPWLSTLRHTAKEGRVYVIGCCSAVHRDDIPDRFGFKEKYLPATDWLNPGDSAIVDPDGKHIAGPAQKQETILYAEIDPAQMRGPRFQLDTAGHYARPDVFQLLVDRRERPMIRGAEDSAPERLILDENPDD